MALSKRILPAIFHEKQEPDSSLCAQHCLNNLVQESIWTAADLADLAQQLDERELQARNEGNTGPGAGNSVQSGRRRRQGDPEPLDGLAFEQDDFDDDNAARLRRVNPLLNAGRSRNMDDSGFFSVQVMDEALKSFDLQLVRWRSQDMQSLHSNPEKMEAFVLNLASHWFVLRKFGKSKHFWYDLNSFHPQPKHVSPLYLGLQIDQAENEGYSVFVVLPSRDSGPSTSNSITSVFNLPHCPADDTVAELAEEARTLTSQQAPISGVEIDLDEENLFQSTGSGPDFVSATYAGFGGAGNEDEELNRAIEASLQGWKAPPLVPSDTTAVTSDASMFETDDPELAAAIAASLADGSAELSTPAAALAEHPTAGSAKNGVSVPSPGGDNNEERRARAHTVDEEDLDVEVETDEDKAPTAEELRLKRLARFGG